MGCCFISHMTHEDIIYTVALIYNSADPCVTLQFILGLFCFPNQSVVPPKRRIHGFSAASIAESGPLGGSKSVTLRSGGIGLQ